ncbi:ankyrin repeat domain-containing protein [Legionella quinlivanii]|uniref:ankyrin repeat domain-containing protein n=1 Tax=Legionella quinlivanii TaxID=45073 RepID=UPI0022443181|nr:ankyrin repeat domain-containing protein [Legionella quinlivanii]MCW8452456.1 ankyrin repeat domain-containing protein [Legionella quinlivanii]
MKSEKLLEILNKVQNPFEILTVLSQENFSVNERTEEGDSIFHLLLLSRHVKEYNFYQFLEQLISAGGNPNIVDQKGRSFLTCYLEIGSTFSDDTLKHLLESECLDIQQKVGSDGYSLFELVCNSSSYSVRDLYKVLLRHPKFDPNQRTSKHNSVLLHLICELKLSNVQQLEAIVTNTKTDINVQNPEGKTALACILSDDSYKNVDLINQFIKHPTFNINMLDNEGNNYLQLTILHCNMKADAIAKLLVQSGINVTHRNNEGNSVFDLIIENKAGRSEYANTLLLLEILKLHPSSLLESYRNGKTILAELIKSRNYSVQSELNTLLELCINLPAFNIKTLDSEGNNYLQLVVRYHNNPQDAARQLIQKGIDLAHKNSEGKTVFDLIKLKVRRTEFIIEILKLQPSALHAEYHNGESILGRLLRKRNNVVRAEFPVLLELCKGLPDSSEFIKKLIIDCINDFQNFRISTDEMDILFDGLLRAKIDIDIEYLLVMTTIVSSDIRKQDIANYLKKIRADFDFNQIFRYIERLTKEGSIERQRGLQIFELLGIPIDCFDSTALAWEEQFLRSKRADTFETDTTMFGHLFSLNGSIPANNKLKKLTGSFSHETTPFMVHLMNAYVSHCESSGAHHEQLEAIRQVRNMTVKAMRYFFAATPFLGYSPKADNFTDSILSDIQSGGVEIVTGWSGHAINLIIKQDDLYRNNAGGCSTDATTEAYKITRPDQLTDTVFRRLYQQNNRKENKTYIQQNLHEILGLEFNQGHGEDFQTVGNCGLYSQLIALKTKYRLFLPPEIANRIYEDSIEFFEQFFLKEYLSCHAKNAALPHILMRLINQKLLVENKLELIGTLIKEHFTSASSQDILQTEFMIKRWLLIINGESTQKFDEQLQALSIILDPGSNRRRQILDRFLKNQITADDLDEIKSWSSEEQTFQGYHLLHIAVLNDNISLASSLLGLFPKAVNLKNWFDDEPLCLVKSVKMINLLVSAGASVDGVKPDNALDNAVRKNRLDLVLALLKQGAKASKHTAYYAATKDPKILEAIMEYHPEAVKKHTHSGRSAVHAAANGGHNENLRSLIYYGGAHPAARDVNGITPLYLALKKARKDTAELLMNYPGTLFCKPYRGDSLTKMVKEDEPLRQKIKAGSTQSNTDCAYFKQFQSQYKESAKEDIDYLIIAIRKNDLPAIRGALLTFDKINVFHSSNLFCTSPLMEAIHNLAGTEGQDYAKRFELVQLLLNTSGIDMNKTTSSTEPHLFWATSINDLNVLELFLKEKKLNPNQQDNMGYTALHDAVERGHLECVKRLLQDSRVDSSIENHLGQTAADLKGFGDYRKEDKIRACREEVARHQQEHKQKQEQALSTRCVPGG